MAALVLVAIDLYIHVLAAECVLSHLPEHRHRPWALRIARASSVVCGPIRGLLGPRLAGVPFDISPLIAAVLLSVLASLL